MTDIRQPKRWPGLKLSCFLGQRKKNCKCRKSVSSKKTRMRIGYPKLWHIWKLWHNLFKKTFYCQNGMKSIVKKHWIIYEILKYSKYLVDQLTLFQPGRADHPHLLLLAPPMFFTFRQLCILIVLKLKTNLVILRSDENKNVNSESTTQWYCLGLVEHISLRIPTQFGKPNQTQLHSKHLLNAYLHSIGPKSEVSYNLFSQDFFNICIIIHQMGLKSNSLKKKFLCKSFKFMYFISLQVANG